MPDAIKSSIDDYASKAYIPDKAPLICLVLYINLEFDDEKHRVEQINTMFSSYQHDDYMAQLIEIMESDKETNAFYQITLKASKDGLIEKFDPDFDTDGFGNDEQKIEKFYTVSFIAWAEQAGFKIPEYVMLDLDYKVDMYYRGRNSRDTARQNFLKITKEEFEQSMNEPLWRMTDALLYLLGYKTNLHEDDKVRFLRFKPIIRKTRQYILDAVKTKEFELYDYHIEPITNPNTDDFEKQRDAPFFASKVRPKVFIKWTLGLPLDFPTLKEHPKNTLDKSQSKTDMIKDLLTQEQAFRFCGPSDDPDEITGVTVSYRYLMTQIKTQTRSYLPENIGSQLDKIEVEVNDIYSVYEAQAQLHALLPDIEDALKNGNKTSTPPVQKSIEAPFQIKFSDISGEVILNEFFIIATPKTNGQNYKIIRYLAQNPNRFVTVDELKEKALDGKDLDKRLTDFVAQINMNKDMGKLFFDTGKDSIRLNNPVTVERMAEKNVKRVRIKPA